MKEVSRTPTSDWFHTFANRTSQLAGSPAAFATAALIIVVWGLAGPFFGFSDTWQLVINTGTTIVTFLMVFLIQHTQNRDTAVLQLKLSEAIIALKGAENVVAIAEDMTEKEIDAHKAKIEQEASNGGTQGRRKRSTKRDAANG